MILSHKSMHTKRLKIMCAGDTFYWGDNYWILTDKENSDGYRLCVDIENGTLAEIQPELLVKAVDIEAVMK